MRSDLEDRLYFLNIIDANTFTTFYYEYEIANLDIGYRLALNLTETVSLCLVTEYKVY